MSYREHALSRANAAIKELLRKTYPDFRGRKITLESATTINFGGSFWDGGSRTQAIVVNLDTFEAIDVMTLGQRANGGMIPAPWSSTGRAMSTVHPLPENAAVVQHIISCGRDLGINIIVHPNRLARALAEFTAVELASRGVCIVCRSPTLRPYFKYCRKDYLSAATPLSIAQATNGS